MTPDEASGAIWSRAGLAAYGITPGPGTVLVLGGDGCPLAHVSDVLDYAAGESAGQCGPCMFGIPALAEDMRLLRHCCLDRVGVQRLGRRLGLLPGRGACRFPDGVAGYARSALRVFAGEVSAHLAGICPCHRCQMPARGRTRDHEHLRIEVPGRRVLTHEADRFIHILVWHWERVH